jgi:capsid protein
VWTDREQHEYAALTSGKDPQEIAKQLSSSLQWMDMAGLSM